jgi:hypothetical protein
MTGLDFFRPDAENKRQGPDRRQRATPMFSRYWLRGRRRGTRRGSDKTQVYVDRYTRMEWTLVAGIMLMSLADLVFTLAYLQRGGGEANPLMRWALEWGGESFFAFLKMLLTTAGALFLLLHARFRRVRAAMILLFTGYVLLMLYHSFLIWRDI